MALRILLACIEVLFFFLFLVFHFNLSLKFYLISLAFMKHRVMQIVTSDTLSQCYLFKWTSMSESLFVYTRENTLYPLSHLSNLKFFFCKKPVILLNYKTITGQQEQWRTLHLSFHMFTNVSVVILFISSQLEGLYPRCTSYSNFDKQLFFFFLEIILPFS